MFLSTIGDWFGKTLMLSIVPVVSNLPNQNPDISWFPNVNAGWVKYSLFNVPTDFGSSVPSNIISINCGLEFKTL